MLHIYIFLGWSEKIWNQVHPLLLIFTSIMAAKGTKSKLAAITTLALPIMFLFAWSRGACGSTGTNTHEIQIQIHVYVKHNRMYNISSHTSAKTAQLAAAADHRSWEGVLSGSLQW